MYNTQLFLTKKCFKFEVCNTHEILNSVLNATH